MSVSIGVQYRGYLKKIKKEVGDSYETFARKVRAAAKDQQELPSDLSFQYLDEVNDLIAITSNGDLVVYLEMVQKPKLCIKNYSVLTQANTSSNISNIQSSPSKPYSQGQSAILLAELSSSAKKQENSRVDEGGELMPCKKEEASTDYKRDYRNQIYRLFNPNEAGSLSGPEITEQDLQQNSFAAVKAIRHASKSLANSIVRQFDAWEREWQTSRIMT